MFKLHRVMPCRYHLPHSSSFECRSGFTSSTALCRTWPPGGRTSSLPPSQSTCLPLHKPLQTTSWGQQDVAVSIRMLSWPLKVSGTAHRSGKGCRRESRTAYILRHSSGCGLFQSDKTKAFCFQHQTTAASPNDARGPPCSRVPACNRG